MRGIHTWENAGHTSRFDFVHAMQRQPNGMVEQAASHVDLYTLTDARRLPVATDFEYQRQQADDHHGGGDNQQQHSRLLAR